jgi:hypothetical protein
MEGTRAAGCVRARRGVALGFRRYLEPGVVNRIGPDDRVAREPDSEEISLPIRAETSRREAYSIYAECYIVSSQ